MDDFPIFTYFHPLNMGYRLPRSFFFQIPVFFPGLLPYGRKHHQLAGGCAKLFAQENALVSTHCGKITENACAR